MIQLSGRGTLAAAAGKLDALTLLDPASSGNVIIYFYHGYVV